jgi:hypothetical protein
MNEKINLSIPGKIKGFLYKAPTAIFYENGKLSLGRIMLIIIFITLYIMWIRGYISGSDKVPGSMINVFYSLLGYCFGTKFAGVARKVVDNKKKEQLTSTVEDPDA